MAQSLPGPSSISTPQHPPTPVTQELAEDLNLRLSLTHDTNGEVAGPSAALVRPSLCQFVMISRQSFVTFWWQAAEGIKVPASFYLPTDAAVKPTPFLQYDRWCQWSGPGSSSSYGTYILLIIQISQPRHCSSILFHPPPRSLNAVSRHLSTLLRMSQYCGCTTHSNPVFIILLDIFHLSVLRRWCYFLTRPSCSL